MAIKKPDQVTLIGFTLTKNRLHTLYCLNTQRIRPSFSVFAVSCASFRRLLRILRFLR